MEAPYASSALLSNLPVLPFFRICNSEAVNMSICNAEPTRHNGGLRVAFGVFFRQGFRNVARPASRTANMLHHLPIVRRPYGTMRHVGTPSG